MLRTAFLDHFYWMQIEDFCFSCLCLQQHSETVCGHSISFENENLNRIMSCECKLKIMKKDFYNWVCSDKVKLCVDIEFFKNQQFTQNLEEGK